MDPRIDALIACKDLNTGVQWACRNWINDCWNGGLQFTVTLPVRIHVHKQQQYWEQGRSKAGNIVTEHDGFISKSPRQLGLELEVEPVKCTYEQLAQVAAKYGITCPGAPYFQFDQVERWLPGFDPTTPVPENLTS